MTSRTVRFFFDFISPYSWMALMGAEEFERDNGVRLQPCPVVYAALLDSTGLVGPAETPVKRRYTFQDVIRCAARAGLRFQGPPEHPFRSLEALRTVCLYREDPRALALAARLADLCWGEGRPLTDPETLAQGVADIGLDPDGLVERIADPAVKDELRRLTDDALTAGVFGVPTFLLGEELFWGHDRMSHLADRLSGRLAPGDAEAERMLRRPRGAERKNSPMARDGDRPS